MAGKLLAGALDREFITIYFLQEARENRRVAIRRVWLVIGLIAFLFGVVFLRVWQQMQVVKLGYQINQSRLGYHRLLDEHRILLSQRNALASLERIEAIARQELELEAPNSKQLVFLVDPAAKGEGLRGFFSGSGIFKRWFKK
jgi:cell division protein FtsL